MKLSNKVVGKWPILYFKDMRSTKAVSPFSLFSTHTKISISTKKKWLTSEFQLCDIRVGAVSQLSGCCGLLLWLWYE